MKLRMEPWKIDKNYTNYGWNNHNVETCKIKKKEEPIVSTINVINQL
jgi:hypothetical protein